MKSTVCPQNQRPNGGTRRKSPPPCCYCVHYVDFGCAKSNPTHVMNAWLVCQTRHVPHVCKCFEFDKSDVISFEEYLEIKRGLQLSLYPL